MMTKTEFFALLNDKENRIGVTAHIAARTNSNGTQSLFIEQTGAPNAGLSNHKAHTTTIAAFNKYNAWLNEWFMAQAAAAQARIDLLAEIEADHAEGEAVVAAINNDITVGIAHAEALEVNAIIDEATRRASCYSDLPSADVNAIRHAIDHVSDELQKKRRYNASFIVKTMIATNRLARAARTQARIRHQEMLARCATATNEQILSEIPF